jgi:hypothetical protein
MALENCRLFLSGHNREELKSPQSLFARQFESVKENIPGLQPILLQGLFSNNRTIQENSFDLLLQAWYLLPDSMVDGSSCGLMYTILYCLTWLFAHIRSDADILSGESAVSKRRHPIKS